MGYKKEMMKLAIDEARIGIYNGDGGPFGSCIVRNGKVIATGHNCVVANNDPTCHGEIDAIRKAGRKMNTFDLSGCELYTTGEPCPMCLAAIMWANINKVYYGCTIKDNEHIGFRDAKFDEMMGGREGIPEGYLECKDREDCLALFTEYNEMGKVLY